MRVALYVNAVAAPWSFADEDSWGGGEEAIVCLARALARARHDVTVFWQGPTGLDGSPAGDTQVTYLPYAAVADTGRFDVAIYRKTPEALGQVQADRAVLWTDQAERPFDAAPYAAVVVASPFLRRCLATAYPRSAPLLRIIPDGIDPGAFLDWNQTIAPFPDERDHRLVLHASSPDRGLLTLLDLWPDVLAQQPETRLLIAYGWDLYLQCGGDPALKAAVEARIAALPADAVTMQRLTRREVHAAFCTAGIWAYWCTGGEFFCQSAVKAQAGGCVPVVRPWGALHETVQSGLRVRTRESFVRALLYCLDPERQEVERQHVRALPPAPTWDDVAALWTALLDAPPGPVEHPDPLVAVPATPLLCPEPGFRHAPAIAELVTPWLTALKPPRLWCDPALTPVVRGNAARPSEADASLLGWALEDAPLDEQDARGVAGVISDLGIPDGQPVCVLTSEGPWRSGQRRRTLDTTDLRALFGRQPEFGVRAAVVDGEGSALYAATFRFDVARLGLRDVQRRVQLGAPRETLSVCFMVRDVADVFRRTLDSVAAHADEIVIVDTGSTDDTAAVVDRFERERGVPIVRRTGTSPRWCFDCLAEHAVGELRPGHRVAGFETARNESIAAASGDWILWLDADEELLEGTHGCLAKYLRPNAFAGYSIPQHHHANDPPAAAKVDFPVRLFRRVPDGTAPGWCTVGPDAWPTFHPGLTARFTGIVHEHPGLAPAYIEGLGPVIILSDITIAHTGYYTEWRRRARFQRNWPLMVADRQKYPGRRLGIFLDIRDYTQHMRYTAEQANNQVTPEAIQYAGKVCEDYETHFLGVADAFATDALGYYSHCAAVLRRGPEFSVTLSMRWPELMGDQKVDFAVSGRCRGFDDVLKHLEAQRGNFALFAGPHL